MTNRQRDRRALRGVFASEIHARFFWRWPEFRSVALGLFFGLMGCAGRPDYVSARGATYYLEGATWRPEQIEEQEGSFVANFSAPHQVIAALQTSTVFVSEQPITCGEISSSGRCAGFQLGGRLEVADFGCPSASALTHEVAHWIQARAGIYDPDHTDTALWALTGPRPCEP